MGSAVSLAVGLILTFVVFLFMGDYQEHVADERGPLLQAIAIFTVMAAVSCAAFYSELRLLAWRWAAQLATVAVIAVAAWAYWPRL